MTTTNNNNDIFTATAHELTTITVEHSSSSVDRFHCTIEGNFSDVITVPMNLHREPSKAELEYIISKAGYVYTESTVFPDWSEFEYDECENFDSRTKTYTFRISKAEPVLENTTDVEVSINTTYWNNIQDAQDAIRAVTGTSSMAKVTRDALEAYIDDCMQDVIWMEDEFYYEASSNMDEEYAYEYDLALHQVSVSELDLADVIDPVEDDMPFDSLRMRMSKHTTVLDSNSTIDNLLAIYTVEEAKHMLINTMFSGIGMFLHDCDGEPHYYSNISSVQADALLELVVLY